MRVDLKRGDGLKDGDDRAGRTLVGDGLWLPGCSVLEFDGKETRVLDLIGGTS